MSHTEGALAGDLDKLHVVVAAMDAEGRSHFIDSVKPLRQSVPGVVESAFIWTSEDALALPTGMGGVPAGFKFPLPGGTNFGIACFAPHSAAKMDVRQSLGEHADGIGDDPGMHRSDTIDYEIILSGKVDIVLDNGETRTLGPGSCLIMAGPIHAWKNHYDEPCVYAFIQVGAKPAHF